MRRYVKNITKWKAPHTRGGRSLEKVISPEQARHALSNAWARHALSNAWARHALSDAWARHALSDAWARHARSNAWAICFWSWPCQGVYMIIIETCGLPNDNGILIMALRVN